MQAHHLWTVALLISCAGAPAGSSSPPSAANAQPPNPAAPAGPAALASVALECELTKTDGACNQAKPKSMSITVNRVNTCTISSASHELTLSVEDDKPSGKDSIRVQVPDYPNATGHYSMNAPNMVALADGDGSTAANGAAPHGAGSECTTACTADVQETPGGVRKVALGVSCKELCIANECLRCKPSGGGDVTFKLEVDCP